MVLATHAPSFPANNVCNLPAYFNSFPTGPWLSAMQTASPGDPCHSGRHGAEDRTSCFPHPSQCQVLSLLSFSCFFKLPIIFFSHTLRYLVLLPPRYQVVILPLSPPCWSAPLSSLDMLAYGCTLASAVLGEQAVFSQLASRLNWSWKLKMPLFFFFSSH